MTRRRHRAPPGGGHPRAGRAPAPVARRFRSPHTLFPHAHFLSNGTFTVVTNAGGGGSTCRGRVVTRIRRDRDARPRRPVHLPARRAERSRLVRDLPADAAASRRSTWSVSARQGRLPAASTTTSKRGSRSRCRRRTMSRCGGSRSPTAAIVRARSRSRATSELVLGAADGRLRASRVRKAVPRDPMLPDQRRDPVPPAAASRREPELSRCTSSSIEGRLRGAVEWETDRARFLGPRPRAGRPVRARRTARCRGTTGAVLDPIAEPSLPRAPRSGRVRAPRVRDGAGRRARRRARAGPEVPRPRRAARARWRSRSRTRRWRSATWASPATRRSSSSGWRRACSHADASLRAAPALRERNVLGQPGLWAHGISGDLPILLVRVVEEDDLPLVRQVLQAQDYWRLKGLHRRRRDPQRAPGRATATRCTTRSRRCSQAGSGRRGSGGRAASSCCAATWCRRRSARCWRRWPARCWCGDRGELANQLDLPYPEPRYPPARSAPRARPEAAPPLDLPLPELAFANGQGGFTAGGREYTIVLEGDAQTPRPWVNVLANPDLGTVVTSSGASFTWAENSRENRLTPFANDPVTDPSAERLFVLDDETGEAWSPQPGLGPRATEPVRCLVRHRPGVTRFERASHGLRQELAVLVAANDPVKIQLLRLTNATARARRLRLYAYNEWALCSSAPARAPARRDRVLRGSGAGPQRIQRGVPRSRGLCRLQPAAPLRHRRPHGVPRPQRRSSAAGRARTRRPVRPFRRGPRSLRRAGDRDRAGPR